jgi:hypothetical protein
VTGRVRTHHADPETLAYMITLEDENVRLRHALEELYGATHGYLNQTNGRGRMRAGTPRLNAALADASRALHSER